MTYSAFDDTRRGTPLLMGKVRVVGQEAKKAAALASPWEIRGLLLVAAVLIPFGIWFLAKGRRRKPVSLITSKAAIDPQWVPFEAPAPPPLPQSELEMVSTLPGKVDGDRP